MSRLTVEGAEDQVRRLTVRVRELEEELAEWRRRPEPDVLAPVDEDRVWRAWLALGRPSGWRGGLRLVLALLDHAGEIMPRRAVLAVCSTVDPDMCSTNLVAVYVSHARRFLRPHGLADAIQHVWKGAYLVDATAAAAIKALIGEGE